MSRLTTSVFVLALLLSTSGLAWAQAPAPPPPTDRTKATRFSADELRAALGKLPTDRPSSAVRVFSLAPYNVNVEQRQPRAQGASLHEAQAELFYVIEGAATLLTGGTIPNPTRTGTNLAGPTIENGVRTRFAKGDFLIVPSGVPHQFVDITAPVHLMSIYLPNAPQ
ncbi:MAG: cupin domain-containing protein [Vicinamibacterales bacterium]